MTASLQIGLPLSPAMKGGLGAADATDRIPAWLHSQLDTVLERFQGKGPFTSEGVRGCLSPAAAAWLGATTRTNCFPGWWKSAVHRHGLQRAGRTVASQREGARGRHLTTWLYPSGVARAAGEDAR